MLEEKILNDYQEAMKQKDGAKSSLLSFLRSSLMNTAIEKKKDKLDDAEVVAVIKKHVKRCQDSIEQFKTGSRADLVKKETNELKILESYLPAQLSTEEISKIINAVIEKTGVTSIKEMGKVIKEVMNKVVGRADGKKVSELVKQKLASNQQESKEVKG